ncbi:hypothetical protein BKA56DRAFT_94872 [Ilyonectria sp. MPI-CAGE-AT-0026]|nr:hypothetical protein BKA56DRAFT_94872 [Ilyonectria sp. MPI-CAGE-AT-0026]
MTTNSFGTALPRFDFPPPEPPVISRFARVAKVFPLAAFAATGVAAWYYINTTNVTSGSDCNHGLGVRYLFRGWEHGELVHSGVSSLEIYISGPLLLLGKLRVRGEDAVCSACRAGFSQKSSTRGPGDKHSRCLPTYARTWH